MSKKSKNFVIVLIGIFFVSLALLFSENSSKIVSFPNEIKQEVEGITEEEFIFGNKSEDVEEEVGEEIDVVVDNSNENSTLSENTYRVVKVVDGDTVDVNINGKVERLRLIGIDTPETKDPRVGIECFGKEASEKTKELLFGKNVSLEADNTQSDRDRYGRLLRYVFLADGTNFNEYMIKEGYAHEYTYDSAYKYQTEFKNAEAQARNAEKGIWSPETCPIN